MEKMTKVTLGLLTAGNIIAMIASDAVLAGEIEKPNNYIQGQMGMFFPGSDLDDADLDEGFQSAFSYGRYLTKHLKLEGTLDGSTLDRDFVGANATAGAYSRDDHLSSVGILIALKGVYPVGSFDLFGGVGVGLYSVRLESEIDSRKLGTFDTDEDDSVFGAQFSLGTNYNITERFYVGVEGKYLWTEDAEISMRTAEIPIEYDGDLSGYSLAFTAGWRF